jgi:hypothetical protein
VTVRKSRLTEKSHFRSHSYKARQSIQVPQPLSSTQHLQGALNPFCLLAFYPTLTCQTLIIDLGTHSPPTHTGFKEGPTNPAVLAFEMKSMHQLGTTLSSRLAPSTLLSSAVQPSQTHGDYQRKQKEPNPSLARSPAY